VLCQLDNCQPEGENLPTWGTVKRLKSDHNAKFQAVAAKVAKREKTKRVHLDLEYWKNPK